MAKKQNSGEDKQVKRLYRSQKNKVFGGVCGGIAEYFEIDVAIVRILTVLLALFNGIGLIIYLCALFVVPLNPSQAEYADSKRSSDRSQTLWLIIGGILILCGLAYLFDNFSVFPYGQYHMYDWDVDWDVIWPVLLVVAGIFYIIYVSKNKKSEDDITKKEGKMETNGKKLNRSVRDRKLAGVCGGLADYFNLDPTIIRVLYAVFTIFTSIILGIIVYIVMAIVVPEEELQTVDPSTSKSGEKK